MHNAGFHRQKGYKAATPPPSTPAPQHTRRRCSSWQRLCMHCSSSAPPSAAAPCGCCSASAQGFPPMSVLCIPSASKQHSNFGTLVRLGHGRPSPSDFKDQATQGPVPASQKRVINFQLQIIQCPMCSILHTWICPHTYTHKYEWCMYGLFGNVSHFTTNLPHSAGQWRKRPGAWTALHSFHPLGPVCRIFSAWERAGFGLGNRLRLGVKS